MPVPHPAFIRDDPDAPADPVVRTLLMTDLVASTRMIERLGDGRASEIATRHDREARDLLPRFNGLEIDKTDGFLLLFERPVDAVAYALAYHRILSDLSAELGVELAARAGIHLGEVILRENSADDVARGAKPLEVEGIAKPTAARVMMLARGAQTLLTRGVFDLARRSAAGRELPAREVAWLAHGSYRFKGVEEPLEIFEVGARGKARLSVPPDTEKAQRVVTADDELTLGWRPAPDLPVPQRPHWILKQRIGMGGFGEVWLAVHEKTRDKRVFKFCLDARRLRSLKREITLFRLLKETLGHRDDIARVLDCNFDEAPYFLESEYTEGGNLIEWAAEQGGLAEVPLATRLELVAQVADALGAAHSVGVLHKDVKPANVLVRTARDGRPRAQLTDFGIGRVVDESVLSDHGITLLGMTEILPPGEEALTGGTYLYMAPEVIEGKVGTVQADIYALGIMLYQMVVGDFAHPLSPGWRRDVPDEILAGDIARLVDGSPERRLASAAELAERLRRLAERRAESDARRAQESAHRRWRLFASFGGVATAVLLVVSVLAIQAFHARRDAELRRGQAETLISFMMKDLRGKLEPLGRLDILNEVGGQAMAYFASVPETSLTDEELLRHSEALHQIGDVQVQLGDLPAAMKAFEESLALAAELVEREPTNPDRQLALGAAHFWTGHVLWRQGDLDGALRELRSYLRVSEELAARDPENHQWQLEVAYAHGSLGTILQARGELESALQAFRATLAIGQALSVADTSNTDWQFEVADAHNKVGLVLDQMGDLTGALEHYRKELEIKETLVAQHPDHATWRHLLAVTHNNIAIVLRARDDFRTALEHLEAGATIIAALVAIDPSNTRWRRELAIAHGLTGDTSRVLGSLDAAWAGAQTFLEIMEELVEKDPTDSGWLRDLSMAHYRLGQILEARGDLDGALAEVSTALAILEPLVKDEQDDRIASRFMSIDLLFLGSLLDAKGAGEQARAAWHRALGIIEPLASESETRLHLEPWARSLLLLDRIEAAAPIVDKLLRLGYRNREFLGLCRRKGLSIIDQKQADALIEPQTNKEATYGY